MIKKRQKKREKSEKNVGLDYLGRRVGSPKARVGPPRAGDVPRDWAWPTEGGQLDHRGWSFTNILGKMACRLVKRDGFRVGNQVWGDNLLIQRRKLMFD